MDSLVLCLFSSAKVSVEAAGAHCKVWDSYVSRTSNYQILKVSHVTTSELRGTNTSEASQLKLEASAARPAQDFLGRVLAVDSTGAQGPAGVKLQLHHDHQTGKTDTRILPPAPAAGVRRGPMQPQSSFIDPIAMVMATVGTGVCVYSSRQMSQYNCQKLDVTFDL
ncbi:hypothetical protein INR49_009273 [Caranx melampygus]|nr:hypothetical protein INR49_009273 [Caranx melampygus]